MRLKWYFFSWKCLHVSFEIFLSKNQKKIKHGKIYNIAEKQKILKKVPSSFWKAPLTMLDGAKYPWGSRVVCLYSFRSSKSKCCIIPGLNSNSFSSRTAGLTSTIRDYFKNILLEEECSVWKDSLALLALEFKYTGNAHDLFLIYKLTPISKLCSSHHSS